MPSSALDGLIRGGASAPIQLGQIVVMLQGRIFTESDEIFLQSRLRGFRRNAVGYGEAAALSGYFAEEGLAAGLRQGSYRLHAGLPALDVTFAPRALTFADVPRSSVDRLPPSSLRSTPSAPRS